MSVQFLSAAWATKVSDPAAKLVLVSLADHANDAGQCWPSVATLVACTELSERTVQRAIAKLVAQGVISRAFSKGHSTRYALRITPVTVTPHPRHSGTQNHQ